MLMCVHSLNDFMERCTQKSAQTITVQLNEFSHSENTCMITIQNKKQKLISTPEAQPYIHASFYSTFFTKVIPILTSITMEYFCQSLKFIYLELCSVYCVVSDFVHSALHSCNSLR